MQINKQYEYPENLKKYARRDPKTGEITYDYETFQQEINPRITSLTLSPGGKVATTKTKLTKKEQMALSSIAGPGQNFDPIASDPTFSYEYLKKRNLAPTIFEDSGAPTFFDPTLTSAINVNVSKDYIWGEGDVTKLYYYLGYKATDIPQQCQMRLDVSVMSDKDRRYKATIMAGNTAQIAYDGTIKELQIRPLAVCNKPQWQLPKSGAIFFDFAGKYAVQLARASCSPTTSMEQTYKTSRNAVVIQYAGDSQVTCTFIK
jgi:hypothetical protein